MKNSQRKLSYISNEELYSLWKYLNGYRLVGRKLLNFDDITASGENRIFVSKFINSLKSLGIDKLNGLVFHKDIYLKYNKGIYDALKAKKDAGSLVGVEAKAFEFLEEFLAGDIDRLYKNEFGIFDFIFYENIIGILEFFEFSVEITASDKQKLSSFLDDYM